MKKIDFKSVLLGAVSVLFLGVSINASGGGYDKLDERSQFHVKNHYLSNGDLIIVPGDGLYRVNSNGYGTKQ